MGPRYRAPPTLFRNDPDSRRGVNRPKARIDGEFYDLIRKSLQKTAPETKATHRNAPEEEETPFKCVFKVFSTKVSNTYPEKRNISV